MTTVIKAENISKQYRLGYVGSGSIKDDVKRWWYGIRGKEDPLLNMGESNDRTRKGESDYVWALKDIDFEIQQGDTVGIIGRNGAGKSTLLKLLSKVTAPTTGNIKVKGRIASLLEVGTGFHGELTGRENIYLNGAIMGMRKHEITRRLDEIVDFAGVERYLDTPVKRYSSGMYVRLGFAVAAHLDNEILIVDEVLAVGDAEFQKKCLSKMKDVSSNNGKTVIFVSHNMDAIERLCNKGLFLQNGELVKQGTINSVLENYLSGNLKLNAINNFDNEDFSKLPFKLTKIYTHQDDFIISETFNVVDTIGITIEFSVKSETNLFIPAISVLNDKELDVFHSHDVDSVNYKSFWKKGNYKSTVWIPKNLLSEGNYIIGLGMLAHLPFHVYYHQKELLRIKFSDLIKGDSARGLYNGEFPGVFRPKLIWETIEL